MTFQFKGSSPDVSALVDTAPRASVYRSVFKRAFDIVFSLAALVAISPIIAVFAFLIMLDGHSPFYVQRRVGRNGRVFRMFKLRSMVMDADRLLTEYLKTNPAAQEEWDLAQKLREDPRVTAVGRIIRRSSIDELPQFLNVLLGDMSVVGPRPMMPEQRDLYPSEVYYRMRPGVTGFWQIGDRNNTSFAARARFDVDYYHRMSLRTDLRVILRTVRVMVSGTGV